MWEWLTTLGVALGVGLRAESAWQMWAQPPHGDVDGFRTIARSLSWLRPWASEHREPLWVFWVKVLTVPWGYDHRPLIVWSALAAVGTLFWAARVLWRIFPPSAASIATLVLSVHPLLILDASAGLRESTSTLLVVAAVWMVLDGAWRPASAVIAVLVGVRWELGILALGVCALAAAVSAVPRRLPLMAVVLGALWMAPFMAANSSRYGDPMYHSNTHAGWYMAMEVRGWGGTPSERPKIDWAEYYLSFVGPAESARRVASGAVRISGSIITRMTNIGADHDPVVKTFEHSRLVTLMGALGMLLLVLASVRHPVGRWAVVALLGGVGGYAGLNVLVRYRLVSFLVLPTSLMIAVSIERLAAREARAGEGLRSVLHGLGLRRNVVRTPRMNSAEIASPSEIAPPATDGRGEPRRR